jgi:hypothetical protein
MCCRLGPNVAAFPLPVSQAAHQDGGLGVPAAPVLDSLAARRGGNRGA